MMQLSPDILTGKSREHLQNLICPLSSNHFLQVETLVAFQSLQKRAVKNGFNLQPASSFRDFWRQQMIWNNKFTGHRKVHDDQGNAVDLTMCSDWEKIQSILRWSALPGGSRHHWGTEIDVFDPDLLPQEQKLLLEPWEYESTGYFYELSQWLQENVTDFDFTLPFINLSDGKKIGYEPWHISYLPIAQKASEQFTPEILLSAWDNEEIAGREGLIQYLPEIFKYFWV